MRSEDQMGRTLVLEKTPQRIVSLVPSQTEYLWDLGLGDKLVGITKFCIHPDVMYRKLSKVGGTKNPNPERIRELKPDLIIGNKEENDKESIAILEKEFPVWMSDIRTLEDALEMMMKLGEITGKQVEAKQILTAVQSSLEKCKNLFVSASVAYFIWNEPLMLAGQGTFVHDLLEHCGFRNVAAGMERYPEVSVDQIRQLDPELCFLSSEPYPFKAKHAEQLKTLLPDARIIFVDGEAFSWYGSRLQHLYSYLNQLKAEVYA